MKKKITLIVSQTHTFVTAAFAVVAALAWNSAIQNFFETYITLPKNTVVAKLIYALFVTVITVLISAWLTHIHDRVKKNGRSNRIYTRRNNRKDKGTVRDERPKRGNGNDK